MTNPKKRPPKLSPQMSERIKRVLLAGSLGLLPLIILFGMTRSWHEAEWMAALTAGSMGVFMMILFLFGVMPCPVPREKGQPKKRRKGERT